MATKEPGWFQKICEDAVRKTEARPEWRRHPEAARELRRLDALLAKESQADTPPAKPPGSSET